MGKLLKVIKVGRSNFEKFVGSSPRALQKNFQMQNPPPMVAADHYRSFFYYCCVTSLCFFICNMISNKHFKGAANVILKKNCTSVPLPGCPVSHNGRVILQLIHFDIKPANVLLDHAWTQAKISDVGKVCCTVPLTSLWEKWVILFPRAC
jgi:hypothetical protein